MRVLVTGAAGFIGRAITAALRADGVEVDGVDAMLPAAHGAGAAVPAGVRLLDVADPVAIAAAVEGVDAVCHQAAMVGHGQDVTDMPAYVRENLLATAVLLAAMTRVGRSRLVLASSMVVYGDGSYRTDDGRIVEPAPRDPAALGRGEFDPRSPAGEPLTWTETVEDAPLRPRGVYAVTKHCQEQLVRDWAAETGGSAVALRYHNVYGPWMPRDTPYSGVAAIFRSALERGEAPTVFEDGRQLRDFVHVTDVARANVAALRHGRRGFRAYNVASGHPLALADMARLLATSVGGPEPVVTGRARPRPGAASGFVSDVRHIVASPQRARAELGFTAAVSPASGLAEFATAPLR